MVLLRVGGASSQALSRFTTHWDLAVGVREAIRAVLKRVPGTATREHVQLAVRVDDTRHQCRGRNRFSPVATILIAFDRHAGITA
jgi:hypothetical protein